MVGALDSSEIKNFVLVGHEQAGTGKIDEGAFVSDQKTASLHPRRGHHGRAHMLLVAKPNFGNTVIRALCAAPCSKVGVISGRHVWLCT